MKSKPVRNMSNKEIVLYSLGAGALFVGIVTLLIGSVLGWKGLFTLKTAGVLGMVFLAVVGTMLESLGWLGWQRDKGE